MSSEVIRMTGRLSISIETDDWPVFCEMDIMGNFGTPKGFMRIRKHRDGRIIVYGEHKPSSYAKATAGYLGPIERIVEFINLVGTHISASNEIDTFIAKLPPEKIE